MRRPASRIAATSLVVGALLAAAPRLGLAQPGTDATSPAAAAADDGEEGAPSASTVADPPDPSAIVLAPPEPGANETAAISGLEHPERQPGDGARDAADVLLFLPRNLIDGLFAGAAAAAGLVRDEHLVPRLREMLSTPAGELLLFPTLFAETGAPFSIGARLIANSRHVATAQRVGFGGPNDVVVESRIHFRGGSPLPFVLAIEGLYELEDDIEYFGLGQSPATDPRNHFRTGNTEREALYRKRLVRGITSLGLRPSDSLELFLAATLEHRRVDDSPDIGAQALSQVFAPVSIPGAFVDSWITYVEGAARVDTRVSRGRPTPGVLAEIYAGGAQEIQGAEVAFMRWGGRAAGFIPIYRQTNILSPRLVIDRLIPLGGLTAPFAELPRQPDFRGFDTRRDYLSMVASLDYTWELVQFMGARLFVDTATVAPSFADLSEEHFEALRWAVGFGVDLYTSTTELAQLAFSASPEGARLFLSIGVSSHYGDRQHRD